MDFFTALLAQMPDAVAKGLIWGLMALGVYITYKILDFPDLTVDGSLCTGGAVAAVMIVGGIPAPVARTALPSSVPKNQHSTAIVPMQNTSAMAQVCQG